MDLNWRKSTRSSGNGGACVEVASVSDSKLEQEPIEEELKNVGFACS